MGPSDIMAKVYLWAHPVMSTIYAQWADVGFAEIFSKLSHRFYRPLRQRVCHGLCSMNMEFLYILPGWEGSAADS